MSEHKEVAKLVRKHLKELGLKATVKSSFQKVVVQLKGVSLEDEMKLKDIVHKYSSSNIYSNYEDLMLNTSDSSIPQVDYLIISN